MSENQVVKKGDLVIKTFGSHLNYLRESGIYEKLKDSGLAPEVRFSGSDSIEHVYVQGTPLYDIMLADYDTPELEEDISLFLGWYRSFREKTGNSLGRLDLHKFICAGKVIMYIDFEHCKASYMEADLAAAAVQLYLMSKPFSGRAHEVTCAFVRLIKASLDVNIERFASNFKETLTQTCQSMNIGYNAEAVAKTLAVIS